MYSVDTRPDSETDSLDGRRTLGLLWVYPELRLTRLESESLTLGRDEHCTIPLKSSRISRVHARIDRSGPIWVLSDAGSTNGTRHNGQQVERAPLADNDVVRVGDHVAVVLGFDTDATRLSPLFDEPSPGLLVGPRTRASWQRLVELAHSKLPVVLEGPTGTGKEVYAKALHALSQRPGDFVAINCAAVPETLAESQLFGQARGAFTGAAQASPGVLEASHRGTLLLDEIVDLSLQLQAKLLRALEESEVVRLGETTPRRLDLRIVAATQVPLFELVETGHFRGDLLARLAGGTVRLLPLDKRREEIFQLFTRFVTQAGGDPKLLSPGFVEALCLLGWPLNTRQLMQVAAQAALSAPEGKQLRSTDLSKLMARVYGHDGLGSGSREAAPAPVAVKSDALSNASAVLGARRAAWFERHQQQLDTLLTELERYKGNVSRAARAVGISRQQAHRLLATHDELKGASA